MKYYIIQPMHKDDETKCADIAGPFKTVAECKRFLVNQCLDLCDPGENPNDLSLLENPREWALPSRIVKLVETVRQEPVLEIKAKLVKV